MLILAVFLATFIKINLHLNNLRKHVTFESIIG